MTATQYPEWWLKLSESVGQRVDKLWETPKPFRYRFVFREGVTQTEYLVSSDKLSEISKHDELSYEADLAEGWVIKVGRVDRWLHKIREDRLMIFEKNEEEKFVLMKTPTESEISSNLLKAVHDFKGVDKGLHEEFKITKRWDDIPIWVLIAGTIVFAIVAVYVGIDAGVFKL